MKTGSYVVYSPLGSEVLATFSYYSDAEKADAKRKADESRRFWKTKRDRVGVRHVEGRSEVRQ